MLESKKREGGGGKGGVFLEGVGVERECLKLAAMGEIQRMMMRGKEYTRCRRACGPLQDMNEKKGEG